MFLKYSFCEITALLLRGVVLSITTTYNCLVFNVFLKLILFLFSEGGSCYVAHAGFPCARITWMPTYLTLSKALDGNVRNCLF